MGLEWEGAPANSSGGTASPYGQDDMDRPAQQWQALPLVVLVHGGKMAACKGELQPEETIEKGKIK